jgi:addiction module HigA family antidote
MSNIKKIHPGELLAGMLEDEELTQSDLARALDCPRKLISEICTKKRGIPALMAFKLGKALGQSPQFWMNAQSNWELSQIKKGAISGVQRLVKPSKIEQLDLAA